MEPKAYILARESFEALLQSLKSRGYTLIGPTIRDDVLWYAEIQSVEDFPIGWTDVQGPGQYRLQKQDRDTLFGFTVAANTWKSFLFPPRLLLWRSKRTENGIEFEQPTRSIPKLALIGVRACELAAIQVQDRVFLQQEFVDPEYQARREQAFILAVNCGTAAATCFCTSLGTGPKASNGYDLALTELPDGKRLLIEVGSEQGDEVIQDLPVHPAKPADLQEAEQVIQNTVSQITRELQTEGLQTFLYAQYENPHWDEVAKRCLTCGNCTLVCPTCFCSTVEDRSDLSGDLAERWRTWDSCFSLEFTYLHGGPIRTSAKARYRHWLLHKLATWIDQFGTLGCAGCGRCITWCPAGIDLTEEVRSLQRLAHREVDHAKS